MHGIKLPSCLPHTLQTTFSPKMFEFATGRWLFTPEATNDIPRDVVHLAQMAQRTGQDHDGVALRQYEMREKQYNLKGKEHTLTSVNIFTYHL